MEKVIFPLVVISSFFAVVSATSTGLQYGDRICLGSSLNGFNAPQVANPCNIGPSYWCIPGSNNIAKCNLQWVTNIGVCGYSSGICPTVANLSTFCQTNKFAFSFNGGLNFMPPGNTGVYILAMYWAPGSCPSDGTTGGFCSNYTKAGTIGARTMQLHGFWPDFGGTYNYQGSPALFKNLTNAYQGWNQYCSANLQVPGSQNWSRCHVNGGLCPDAGVTSQSVYDLCMVKYNISECLVPTYVTDALHDDIVQYAAGYANPDFIAHEFSKHGSCWAGYYNTDMYTFFKTAIDTAKTLRAYDATIQFIEDNRGLNVSGAALYKVQNKESAARCSKCTLTEVWFCFGHDADGSPTTNPTRYGLIKCGAGNLNSDTCLGCNQVRIMDFSVGYNLAP